MMNKIKKAVTTGILVSGLVTFAGCSSSGDAEASGVDYENEVAQYSEKVSEHEDGMLEALENTSSWLAVAQDIEGTNYRIEEKASKLHSNTKKIAEVEVPEELPEQFQELGKLYDDNLHNATMIKGNAEDYVDTGNKRYLESINNFLEDYQENQEAISQELTEIAETDWSNYQGGDS